MAEAETKAAFARRKGVNRSTVNRWEERGLLSMTPDGLVKIEKSEWLLADRPANYRGGKTKGGSRPASAARPDETPSQAAERLVVTEGRAPFDHAEAVRIKENYLAMLRQLEFERASGQVVAIEDVVRAVVTQTGRVRNKLLGLPSRVAPRAAVLRSAEQVKALLDEEVVLICQELSLDGHGDITADELRGSIGGAP